MGNFGYKSFNNGVAKSDIQSNTRLAANYITKELRYSSDATLLTTMPATNDPTKKYIYVDGGKLKKYYNGTITNIIGGTSTNITTTLEFEIKDNTVYFKVEETLKNQTFNLDSTVMLLNIGGNILMDGTTGSVISYN